MANWCETSYVIEGTQADLQEIYNAIINHKVSPNASEDWEGDILKALGIDFPEKCYIRGFISVPPDENEVKGGVLRFYASEAWGPTDFAELLQGKYVDINIYWYAEEPGNEFYGTNDAEGKYFSSRFVSDYCIDNDWDTDYFDTKEDMYRCLSKRTGYTINSDEDIEKLNKELNDKSDEEYISIHEIEVIK